MTLEPIYKPDAESPRLFNKRAAQDRGNALYIGRGSRHGNPFKIGHEGDRIDVVRKYIDLLPKLDDLPARIGDLAGRDLICFCHPALCHGHTLLFISNAELRSPRYWRPDIYEMFAPLAAIKALAPLNIWYGASENAVLSNLAARPFKDKNGRAYVSVEHAYQTWKSGAFDEATFAREWRAGVKHQGRPARVSNGWNIDLMRLLIRVSFEANPNAAASLIATGAAPLTHLQDRGVWREAFPTILMRLRRDLLMTKETNHD